MGLTVYFDTYAFCETVVGNKEYEKFRDCIIISNKMNLMELFYGLLSRYGETVANIFFNKFNECCVEIDDETIKQAMKFRLINKNKRLSYVDCVGYILACQRAVPFVTGDRQFEGMPNVEFIK